MSAGDVDVTTRGDVDKLKGNAVGLYSILFLCVTGSAPLAVFIYNTPFTMPYGSGSNGPGDVPLRHDRAHDLLDRVRRDGQEGARCRRHVHLRQPRARTGLGADGRLFADDRLRDLRRRPDRRLLVVRAGEMAAVLGHPRQLDLVRADRRGARRVPRLLRRRDLGTRARDRPDQRDPHHRDLLDLPLRARAQCGGRAGPALERPPHGSRAGGRGVLRVLVVGRIRGRAQLRRGGQGPGQGDPARPDLLVRGRRHALHDHVLGARLRLRHEHGLDEDRQHRQHRSHQRQDRAGRLQQLRARARLGGGRRVLARCAQLPDHHRLAGLRRGAHERGPALHVRHGPRRAAAPLPRQDAPGAQVALHGGHDVGRGRRPAVPASSGSRATRAWTPTSGSPRRA